MEREFARSQWEAASSHCNQYGRVVKTGWAIVTGERLQGYWRWLVVLAFSLLVLASPSLAHADPLPAPGGFRLSAANGYSLSVLSGQSPKTGAGIVLLRVRSPSAQVVYGSPATVTATSIEADLGSVGRIDVDFAPSGELRTEKSPCGEKPVPFDSGSYVGSIDFQGEEGYTEVHTTSAPGDMRMLLGFTCIESGNSEGFGGHSPEAQLIAQGPRFQFLAMKNSQTRPARFAASTQERRGSLTISRTAEASARPGAFDFDVPEGFAQVSPPTPFSGEATYHRAPPKRPSWKGDLAVDFPGRSNVDLTGAGTRAGLRRAVLNPSHPFRIR
jgi:hypothetical protein